MVQQFLEVCENQGHPLQLVDTQLVAYLLFLHNMNYSPLTVKYRWHPIYRLILGKNITVSEDTLDLYDYVFENAEDKPDKKLPVSDILLKQQLEAIDEFLAPWYQNILAKAVLLTVWFGQL